MSYIRSDKNAYRIPAESGPVINSLNCRISKARLASMGIWVLALGNLIAVMALETLDYVLLRLCILANNLEQADRGWLGVMAGYALCNGEVYF